MLNRRSARAAEGHGSARMLVLLLVRVLHLSAEADALDALDGMFATAQDERKGVTLAQEQYRIALGVINKATVPYTVSWE